MPAGRVAVKREAPVGAVKNMFQLAVLCQRSVLKMPAGRAAAKKGSIAAAVKNMFRLAVLC